MKRVLVIANNLRQASFRVRVAALIEPLRRRGFELHVQLRPKWWGMRRLMRSANGYDSVLLQRKLLDPSHARLLRRHARRIYYDVDDAVMYHSRPVGRIETWRTKRRLAATAAIADVVVAGNENLAELFREHGCNVVVLPTVVDPAQYPLKQHSSTDAPRLVWIGSNSTRPYVDEFMPALERAAKIVTGLRLLIVADETVKGSALPIDFEPWSEQTEGISLAKGDIGIAPTPDNRWTRCKCGFKIVQYMAAGLPTIASPVGVNANLAREGETGLIAATIDDWPRAIERLARDASLRAQMGRRARERVEQELNIERIADAWAQILGG
jgi:glycosyltransferase involved in cell wall biosynthesis